MSKKPELQILRAGSLSEWTGWLEKHHRQEEGVWLVFKKKEAGAVPFDYPMALDEALCYGWVDSLIKAMDPYEYMRKFTPRKVNSTWSETNKKRVERLMSQGRMKPSGMEKIEAARQNGMWEKKITPPEINDQIPGALLRAFVDHPQARDRYFGMTKVHQREFNIWINMAKRHETITRRVEETIRLLDKGEPLGLK
jgi:uncharacterized protein YdeI (YjbR/CyaY-like superfamily)